MSTHSKIELVRHYFAAVRAQDRERLEVLLAADFHFSSPFENHIDRDAYFARPYAQMAQLADMRVLNAAVDEDIVFVRYEFETRSGEFFQNVDVFTVRGNQLIGQRAFFGRPSPPLGFGHQKSFGVAGT